MIILNDTLGAVGGSHTLFIRMCGWYRKQGMQVSFFCNNRDNEEIAQELEKIGVSIYVIDTTDIVETARLLKQLDDGHLQVINFWSNRYFDIEAVKYKYDLQVENKIYLIHPKCLIKGDSYKDGLIVNAIRSGYKRIIPKISKASAMISMDEINIAETENYYGVSIEPKPSIIRLPMNVDLINENEMIKEGYENKIIMTSCLADFPYKGYVVGLVDVFVKLKSKFSAIKLLIVCDGEDVGILREKIFAAPEGVQKDITLLSWMSYEKLKDYMSRCMLYIGMGSSVLDSSLRY